MILGDAELENGHVKLKQLGLAEGHPEKEGVLVAVDNLAGEVKKRILNLSGQAQITSN